MCVGGVCVCRWCVCVYIEDIPIPNLLIRIYVRNRYLDLFVHDLLLKVLFV